MANIKNLKPIQSKSEAREKGRKGGIKSGESRRKRKAIKEQLEDILTMPFNLKDKKGNELIEKYKLLGIEGEIDNQMAIAIELFLTAIGNEREKIQAIKTIREIVEDEVFENEEFKVNIRVIGKEEYKNEKM